MAGAQELPRPPVPRHGDLCRFVALLGASVVVFYVVGEPKPSVSVSVRAGCALAGFLLWLVGAALVLLHVQGPQDQKPRFFFSGPGEQEQERRSPIPRLGDLYGFLALLGASTVVFSVVGESKPPVSVSVRAECALAGFLLWLVGAALVLLHVQGLQDQKPRFFFSGPGAQEQERRRPIPRLGDLYGFLALLGASTVVFSVVGEPKPPVSVSVRAGCALAGFVLWLVGAALGLLHIQGPQNLKPRFVISGPGAPAPAPA